MTVTHTDTAPQNSLLVVAKQAVKSDLQTERNHVTQAQTQRQPKNDRSKDEVETIMPEDRNPYHVRPLHKDRSEDIRSSAHEPI